MFDRGRRTGPELAEVGAAIALAANGSRLLERMGLGEAPAAVSTTPTEPVTATAVTASLVLP